MTTELIDQITAVLATHPEGIRRADIARALGVHRSTVTRMLPKLEGSNVLLREDDSGKLFIYRIICCNNSTSAVL